MSRVSLRVRLALLIGLLLALAGAALLAINYGLVSSNLNTPLPNLGQRASRVAALGYPSGAAPPARGPSSASSAPPSAHPAAPKSPAYDSSEAATQHALTTRTLDQLLTQYLAVLAGLVLVAVALGWLLAGRLLRSLTRVTAVARRVTGGNLDQRIGLSGPRDELRELGDTFDGMLARLDAVFGAQRRFVADASHELRTPLAAMRAELEVLDADPHPAPADFQAATLVLHRQLARSEELIEALLALARSQPELLAREPVDLGRIASDALDDVATVAAPRDLRIDARLSPATIVADRRLMSLLVGNLLSNAIKHNHEGGWLETHTSLDGEHALLVVANSGPIVPLGEIDHLTQAFRQSGTARTGEGHGLGLAIVAAVAHAHHGALTIKPIDEGGLRVEVSLPLANLVRDGPAASNTNALTNATAAASNRSGQQTTLSK